MIFNGKQLCFITVAKDNNIILTDAVFHFFIVCCRNKNLALQYNMFGITNNHRTVKGI